MNRIKELRLKKEWRQEDLAIRMNTKQQTVARYETEKLGIDAKTICLLCDIFDCTADYLLCRSDTPTPAPTISAEDAHLIRLFHAVKPEIQDSVMTILEASTPKTKSEVS